MNQNTNTSGAAQGTCRILSLDGGGAKGFYTLGVLKEIEALVKCPLYERFDLIFGTSTGAIIAALLALGNSVDEAHKLYKEYVPVIMRQRNPSARTKVLSQVVKKVFGDRVFTDFKTGIGIVATRWEFEKPMIFKTSVAQAHGREGTFVPGFGCTIADAVQASCSAYPFFEKHVVDAQVQGQVELIDGGYCANNPTLYAIADAIMALKKERPDLRVVSVGVGEYPSPNYKGFEWLIRRFWSVQLLQKTLNINTNSMEQLRVVLFKDIQTIRINDSFERPEMATDLLESNLKKLNMLFQCGSESYSQHEEALKKLFL